VQHQLEIWGLEEGKTNSVLLNELNTTQGMVEQDDYSHLVEFADRANKTRRRHPPAKKAHCTTKPRLDLAIKFGTERTSAWGVVQTNGSLPSPSVISRQTSEMPLVGCVSQSLPAARLSPEGHDSPLLLGVQARSLRIQAIGVQGIEGPVEVKPSVAECRRERFGMSNRLRCTSRTKTRAQRVQ
jgi:hypothetical protein